MKTRMEIVAEGSKTAAARTALAQMKQLKSIINQMREQKEWPAKILEIEQQGIYQIKQDLLNNSLAEKDRINKRLIDLEKAYNKNLKENPVNYESVTARYHGMSDDELRKESMQMISFPKGNNPTVADYLSAELRSRGIDTHTILREKLVENNYRSPWMHSEEGEALQKEAAFYNNVKPGLFLIEATTQDGRTITTAADVQGVYNEL